MKIALLACSKKKLPRLAEASRLYRGAVFQRSYRIAMTDPEISKVFILSAKHGLLEIHQPIEPYDETLKGMTHTQHCEWAWKVETRLEEILGERARYDHEYVVFGGEAYWCLLRGGLRNVRCAWPEGLKGIGGVLRWLKEEEGHARCRREKALVATPGGQADPKSSP